MKRFAIFEILAIAQLFWCDCSAKECTNTPTQFSSHTYRSALLASDGRTWKDEVFLQNHLIHTDDATWSQLLPRKILGETSNEDSLDWAMTYRKMKMQVPGSSNSFRSGQNFLKEVSLHDVRVDPDSVHGRAQQANLEYILSLEVDSLAWSFRETAGMDSPGVAHGGWEKPDCELRGHFVGHYLSASAKAWASTHNDTLKEKMSALVDALSACQYKIGTGYLSAFPSEFFDRFEAIKPVWAPYYTIHKILAGFLDQYSFAANSKALDMAKWMVEYFYNRVQNVITKYTLERHYKSLNEETGGMNDVLYKLYSITGDKKHLVLAHLFDKPCFLGPLAVKADELSGFHANTHIPIVIGSQTRYEVTGDSLHKDIATYFMDVVNSSHSYATGGTSVSEFWSDPKRLASTLQTENEESCTTYNMLKVSRHLFMWTKEIAYADYYERALTNGILGIQRGTEPGVMIYMLPMGRGVSKARSYHGWGTRTNSFWCCYGTGIESFAKLGDSIYFEDEGNQPGVYVIQYISSSLDWKSAQLVINQRVDPVVSLVSYLQATFTFSSLEGTAGKSGTLNLRIPNWSSTNSASAVLNGQQLDLKLPCNFHSVYVSKGDTLALQFPITLRTEPIKDDRAEYASLQAILYGPYLLAGLSFGDWDIETSSASSLSDWIIPIPAEYNNDLISLSQANGDSIFSFTNSNGTITIEKRPEAGTDGALQATFRLIPADSTTASKKKISSAAIDVIGRKVQLEPFDFPGKFVVEQGANENVVVGDSTGSSVFQAIRGLDGQDNTVSLESMSHEGCFLYSKMNSAPGANVQLGCNSESSYARSHALPQLRGSNFKQAASFVLEQGISHYHPISFVAKGATRSFLLLPLLSVRDESYTVYFNIQA